MSYCNYCGNLIQDGERFCTRCGAPVEINLQSTSSEPTFRKTVWLVSMIMMIVGTVLELLSFFLPWKTSYISISLFRSMSFLESMLDVDLVVIRLILAALAFVCALNVLFALLRRPLFAAAQGLTQLLLLGAVWVALYFAKLRGAGCMSLTAGILAVFAGSVVAIFSYKGTPRDVGLGLLWSGGPAIRGVLTISVGSYLIMYVTDRLGMSVLVFTRVMVISNLLVFVVTLIIGTLIDTTRTSLGKARYFDIVLLGAALLGFLLFCLPSSPLAIALLVVLYIIVMMAQSAAAVSDGAYLYHAMPEAGGFNPAVSVGISALLSFLVSLLAAFVLPLSLSQPDMSGFRNSLALLMLVPAILLLLRFLLIREKPEKLVWQGQVGRDRLGSVLKAAFTPSVLLLLGALLVFTFGNSLHATSTTYFFSHVIGDSSLLSMMQMANVVCVLALLFFVPLCAGKGKDVLLVVHTVLAVLGNLVVTFGSSSIPTLMVGEALRAFGGVPLTMLLAIYLLDDAKTIAARCGVHTVGTLFSLSAVVVSLANHLATTVWGMVLSASGYVPDGYQQPQGVISVINSGYTTLPLVCTLLALGLVIGVVVIHSGQRKNG